MDIKYNRNRAQLYLENIIDSSYNSNETDKLKKKAFQQSAENYILTQINALKIKELLNKDANDYMYSAFVSFFNALQGLMLNNFSWATVELYYSLYYLLRAQVHYENYAIFRANGAFYYISAKPSEKIKQVKVNGKCLHNSHESTIAIFKTLFPNNIIFSNTVDFINSIDWAKHNREIVNYLSVEFIDPAAMEFFEKFNTNDLLRTNIKLLLNDSTMAFQPEFAMVGLPIILIKEIINDYKLNLTNLFLDKQLQYLYSIINILAIDNIKSYFTL